MQYDENRLFVAQAVPEIYGENERLKNWGMCFFVIDIIQQIADALEKSAKT